MGMSRGVRIGLSAILGALIPPLPAVAQTEEPTRSAESVQALKADPLHVFSESVQQLSGLVTKSVVQVLTTGFGLSSESEEKDTAFLEAQRGIGAGVVLSPDGYIRNKSHVVEGAPKI